MSKKESTFLSMVVSLLLITLISGFALGFVNDLTIEPKAKAKLEKKINAIKLVLPEFDNNPVEDFIKIKTEFSKDSIEIYPAFKNNQFVGAAVISHSEKGFSGLIKLMVGFKTDGTIQNIEVLEQKETPGLGTKMKDESFLQQFRGKNASKFNLKVKKDGGEVDALTGATITTRAFSESTQMANDIFINNIEVINQPNH
ncbi:RnfABCDGE type electron transport complex subunit G [Pseudalgibacter alginicilyticus]|uniref:Ion-translocating oxidoreductase complex subunit G n=1 Tax=Pseudalgibacter alginicilyticus TaxID=1736674 RepID=A0A0N7HYQ3_9FLAO|nr:RnfABCDGE type electron transport complex subunit G [Pseudalgibacter alginicilyticus]ALJ05894.1 RnfABCDGE type electron transport complex subunit G [Pseudalgibacter alginicilyticus]